MSTGIDVQQLHNDIVEATKAAMKLSREGHLILPRELIRPFTIGQEGVLVYTLSSLGAAEHVIATLHLRGPHMVISWIPMLTRAEKERQELVRRKMMEI